MQLPRNATYLQLLASTAADRADVQCLPDQMTKPTMEHSTNAPSDRNCKVIHRTSISRDLAPDGLPVSKRDAGMDVLRKLLLRGLRRDLRRVRTKHHVNASCYL
jgi:hypothetical protein